MEELENLLAQYYRERKSQNPDESKIRELAGRMKFIMDSNGYDFGHAKVALRAAMEILIAKTVPPKD